MVPGMDERFRGHAVGISFGFGFGFGLEKSTVHGLEGRKVGEVLAGFG